MDGGEKEESGGGGGGGAQGVSPASPSNDEPSTSGRRGLDNKRCGVCGDRALGYNFNAITCESCKAFFRRNALKKKEFRCHFKDQCKVDTVTRRFCQRCRLRKCLEIGMKKEWIMSDEEKMRKRIKIEENRARKIGSDTEGEERPHLHPHTPAPPSPAMEGTSYKPQAVVVGVIRGDACRETGVQAEAAPHPSTGPPHLLPHTDPGVPSTSSGVPGPAHETSLPPTEGSEGGTSEDNPSDLADILSVSIKKEVDCGGRTEGAENEAEAGTDQESREGEDVSWGNFSVQDALNFLQPGSRPQGGPSSSAAARHNMVDSIMDTAIRAEYSPFTLLASPDPTTLNEAERLRLAELSEANRGLLAPLCEDYNFKDLSNPSLINIINLTEIAIRRLIKMAKRINCFKSLCQEDQIALLKGGCTEMMILRSVCAYDAAHDSWKIQQDHARFQDIKLKVLKAAPGNVYEEHKRFLLAFKSEWRRDPSIIFLLCAITLFTPTRLNIVHPEAITHEQCCYLYLLKRYLECQYGGCEGRTVYHLLLQRLNHLHELSENHIRVFLEVNPKEVEPLLIEIFDLKQR